MSPLDTEVLDFIARHVDSVVALELLLLLRRSQETFWAPAALAEQLGVPAETIASIAARLHAHGILARASGTSAFRFAPREAADRSRVETVAALYASTPSAVVAVIRSQSRSESQTSGEDVRA